LPRVVEIAKATTDEAAALELWRGVLTVKGAGQSLRTALPEDLRWVTPHSFRRTVATVVRDDHGPALAQQQLSHAKLATTEAHYLQRQTHGPDVRVTLDKFAGHGGGG